MANKKLIERAVTALSGGGVIIFPTDTVWGIGAAATSPTGLTRLYAIKGRPRGKPTAVLVDSLAMAKRYGIFGGGALSLARRHWPGALTIIVPARKDALPHLVRGGERSVGLRLPKHPLTLAIIRELGMGIAAGSANLAGNPAPLTFSQLGRRLMNAVDLVVRPSTREGNSAGNSREHSASTVVDTTTTPFRVLRQGSVDVSTFLGI